MHKYSVSIKWSEEDEGFIAFVPELPGLSAFGSTPQEATAELQIAQEAYLDSLRDAGEPIPAPEMLVPHSGQIRLRMPKSLHARLAATAQSEEVSLNTYLVMLLSENNAAHETSKVIKDFAAMLGKQHTINYDANSTENVFQVNRMSPPDILLTTDTNNEWRGRVH